MHKKSQENFERRTVRRLIQIRDGEAQAQELWLAFLRKYAYYGVGMKANVWEFAGVGRLLLSFSLIPPSEELWTVQGWLLCWNWLKPDLGGMALLGIHSVWIQANTYLQKSAKTWTPRWRRCEVSSKAHWEISLSSEMERLGRRLWKLSIERISGLRLVGMRL